VVFIAAMFFVKDLPQSTLGLAIGVTLAFCVQWAATLWAAQPSLRNIDWLKAKLFAPELKQMVKAMALTIIGIGAVQVNSLLDALFARYADLSGPAYLYYAQRLYQLPLALFGLALSSALLPPLSRALQQSDAQRYHQLLNFSLVKSFCLMLPITLALFVTGDAFVNLLYGRGAFDALATVQTTKCLWGYTLGLIPAVFVLILAPAFYAMKDYKTPLYAALLSVAINLGLNTLLIFWFEQGSASVAVATSLAAFANAYFLSSALTKKIGPLFTPATYASFRKLAICGLLAALMSAGASYFLLKGSGLLMLFSLNVTLPRDFVHQLIHLISLGGVFILLFFSYAWMVGVKEVFEWLGLKSSPQSHREG
jgi:putative peptidoglycan lipid II flippase